jgi:hypothetical protein
LGETPGDKKVVDVIMDFEEAMARDCERQRSNPGAKEEVLDCVIARAPRKGG